MTSAEDVQTKGLKFRHGRILVGRHRSVQESGKLKRGDKNIRTVTSAEESPRHMIPHVQVSTKKNTRWMTISDTY